MVLVIMDNSASGVKWICFNGIGGGRLMRHLLWLTLAGSLSGQVPEIRYDSVPNLLKLPADLYLGEVSGVAINSKKHIFVFSRGNTTGPAYGATAAQLLEFS